MLMLGPVRMLLMLVFVGGAVVGEPQGRCSVGLVPQPTCSHCSWRPDSCTDVRQPIWQGDVCTAQCMVGYHPTGTSTTQTYTCNCDAASCALQVTAGDELQCQPRAVHGYCGSNPPCESQGCEWSPACEDPGSNPNSKCTARCKAGYYSTTKHGTVEYTCKLAGLLGVYRWQALEGSSGLHCQPACSDVPPHPNQRWRTGGPRDYDCPAGKQHRADSRRDSAYWCKAACARGYRWKDSSDTFCRGDFDDEDKDQHHNDHEVGWYICQADGHWKLENEQGVECLCTPKKCPAGHVDDHLPPGATDGWNTVDTPVGEFGDMFEIKCKQGYVSTGGSGLYSCDDPKYPDVTEAAKWTRAHPGAREVATVAFALGLSCIGV